MPNQVTVRIASALDKACIVAFCQNTFSWGDYIADVYDRWVADANGVALVGLVDGQPVAIIHAAFLDDGVAWIEGVRVHPDFRKLGVGSMIDMHARQWAREHGCRVARLVTGLKNVTAQGLFVKQGYHRVALFNEWEAEPLSEFNSNARVASVGDITTIQSLWGTSVTQEICPLLTDRHWRWSALGEWRIRNYVDAAQVRLLGNGFGLLLAFEESDWNALSFHALCGDRTTMTDLAHEARGEAYYRGYGRIEAQLLDHPEINAAMENAGYRREGGLYLYEQLLK